MVKSAPGSRAGSRTHALAFVKCSVEPLIYDTKRWTISAAKLEARTLQVGAFLLPLIFFWNTFDEFVLPKLLLARLLVLILGGLRIYQWVRQDGPFVRQTPINLPLLAFVASAALATLMAVNPNVALFGTYMRYEGLLTIATYAALFYLVASALRNGRDALSLIRILAASGYVVALFAILQTLVASPFLPPTAGETELTFGGVVRAAGTFGNANALAAFLAMLVPFTVAEVLSSGAFASRAIAANEAVVMLIALGLTFSRGAWVAATIGLVSMLVFRRRQVSMTWVVAGAAGAIAITVFLLLSSNAGVPFGQSLLARLTSLGSPTSGSMATRLHIWQDTIALIASRPVTGYGPDTFGLVYPKFQTGEWAPGFVIDKAHADILQVASTQGLAGVAAYLWMLAAFITTFLRGARDQAGVFGGFVAYQLQLQLNFSYVPAATSFWIFAAAGVVLWSSSADPPAESAGERRPGPTRLLAVPVALVIAAVSVPAVIFPYLADVTYRNALADVARRDPAAAQTDIDLARWFMPTESVYAVAAGDFALRLQGDTVGPDPDWFRARRAFEDAARLGTYLPSVYRHLAIADLQLGRHEEALIAARKAVQLNRFDPANQEVLQQVEQVALAHVPGSH